VPRPRIAPTALDLDEQKRLHGYDRWEGRNRLHRELFLWGYFLSRRALPTWEPHFFRRLEPAGFPPLTQTVWRRRGGWFDQLLGIDVLECPSRLVAHEYLVRILAQFESPLVGRQEDEDEASIGDVSFVGPSRASIAFSRANLVFLIRSAGRSVVRVTSPARQIDTNVVAIPEPAAGAAGAPAIRRLGTASRSRSRRLSRLSVEAAHPEARSFFYKFFSPSGEVLLDAGKLTYRERRRGPQRLTMYAVDDDLAAARAALRLEPS
jgi:hypothetical protein